MLHLERIFNADSPPQFMIYESSPRTAKRFGEVGAEIVKYTEENRTCVTLCPFISADGKCQLLQIVWQSTFVTGETLQIDLR